MLSVRVQRFVVQAHTYECASTGASLAPAEIPQVDVLGRIVVRVVPVVAFQAPEVLILTTVRLREATVRTPP